MLTFGLASSAQYSAVKISPTANDINNGRLRRIDAKPHTSPTRYAAYMNREFFSDKVRSLIDFLAQHM